MELWISGGSWITAFGSGTLSEGREVKVSTAEPLLPEAKDLFSEPLQRYGRFDDFTRLGCAAAALALRDASIEREGRNDTAGMIISSDYEVFKTDMDYYETSIEEGGIYSSPNLFSYTLPVILLGECAIHYNLTGPTFCVGDGGTYGLYALESAAAMIVSGKADRMIAGWLESPPINFSDETDNRPLSGAVFIVLDGKPGNLLPSKRKLIHKNSTFHDSKGRKIRSLTDIFSSREN